MPKMLDAQIEDYSSNALPGMEDEKPTEAEYETKEDKPQRKISQEQYKPSYLPDDDEEDTDDLDTDDEDELDSKQAAKAESKKEAEEFDEILYNKEKVKIPVSERQTYLQKGYNYDKVHGKLTQTEMQIANFEQLTGLKFDDAIKDIMEQKMKTEVEAIVDRDGVTEEEAKKQILREQKAKETQDKAEKILREAEISQEKTELRDKQYFKELESEIDELVKSTPGLKVDTAYRYLLGQNFEKLTAEQKSRTQKSTIADIHDRQRRSVSTTSSEGASPETVLTPGMIAMAKQMGVPLSEVAKTVKRMKR